MQEVESYKLACVVARILDNKLANDITILNISNVSVITDYFVICSADSPTQVKALTGYAKVMIKELYERMPFREETDSKSRWNLIDYGDVVVHILHKEERETYAIEKFWNHACKVEQNSWMNDSEDIKDKLN